MNEKLLSIGSVVLLKNANKRVMIIGYYPTIIDGDNETTYDYSGCLFPEGVMDSQNAMLFNHSDIDKLYYYGLMDKEQNEFINKLTEIVNEEKSNGEWMSTGDSQFDEKKLSVENVSSIEDISSVESVLYSENEQLEQKTSYDDPFLNIAEQSEYSPFQEE